MSIQELVFRTSKKKYNFVGMSADIEMDSLVGLYSEATEVISRLLDNFITMYMCMTNLA